MCAITGFCWIFSARHRCSQVPLCRISKLLRIKSNFNLISRFFFFSCSLARCPWYKLPFEGNKKFLCLVINYINYMSPPHPSVLSAVTPRAPWVALRQSFWIRSSIFFHSEAICREIVFILCPPSSPWGTFLGLWRFLIVSRRLFALLKVFSSQLNTSYLDRMCTVSHTLHFTEGENNRRWIIDWQEAARPAKKAIGFQKPSSERRSHVAF